MATYTSALNLKKPAGGENVLIGDINGNMDAIDVEAIRSRANFAGTYDASSSYSVGDYCIYGGNLFRCTTAIGSGGETWTAGHWTQVAVGDELSALNGKIENNDFHALSSSSANFTVQESTHYHNGYVKRGGFCFVNVSLQCVTPGTEILVFENLPLMTPSAIGTSVVKTVDADDYSGASVGVLMQRGNLYFYGGTAGKKYKFSFVYPVAM